MGEVMSWIEAFPKFDCSRRSQGVSQDIVQEHRVSGPVSGSLVASSFAPTPDETVKALITELLIACNVTIDAEACCFFHGALMSLRHYCRDLNEGPCWNRTPADIQNAQCPHCGLLSQLQTPPSGGNTSRCFFCDGPLSIGSESPTVSALSFLAQNL